MFRTFPFHPKKQQSTTDLMQSVWINERLWFPLNYFNDEKTIKHSKAEKQTIYTISDIVFSYLKKLLNSSHQTWNIFTVYGSN